jgi:hypothetical protein
MRITVDVALGRQPLTGAALEDAHAAAYAAVQAGDQSVPATADILPPLPRPFDEVAAYAALHIPTANFIGDWLAVSLAHPDPRTPWRRQDTDEAYFAAIPNGFIAVRGLGPMLGFEVVAFSVLGEEVTVHRVLPSKKPFGNRYEAQAWAVQVVLADGMLPAGHTWTGCFGPSTPWRPAGVKKEHTERAFAVANGPHGPVVICHQNPALYGRFTIWRGKPFTLKARVLDASGNDLEFQSLREARAYVQSKGWL